MADEVKSAVRVVMILEYFDTVRRAAGVLEIARALNLPQSSTASILRSLVKLGYLAQGEQRLYHPTPRVTLLGSWVDPDLAPDGRLIALMNDLSKLTGETIILAVAAGAGVRYIHIIPSTQRVRLHVNVGDARPLVTSGTGRLFMSEMEVDQVRRAVFRHNALRGPDEPEISLAAVRRDSQQIRRNGYCVSLDRLVKGVGLICAMLPRRDSGAMMAVAIGAPSVALRARMQEFVRTLKECVDGYRSS
ncbi:MAG: IclR family transcriptional regulator [Burkholderiaceae bacterium]